MAEPRAAFTFFHVLWLTGAFLSAVVTYFELRSLLWAFVAGVLGFFVSGIAVAALVIYIVIPRVERGSGWDYEVNCYMLFMFGDRWGS